MADAVSTIQELRARWETEPTSRVFLQLAEEYRRAGQVDEALRVLEVGLKRVPNYPSAHVALARCHLDAGDASKARDVLEQVVRKDATHLVANKLLVQAYLETGELAQARERLTYYGLLNDRDPEQEELRAALEAAESEQSSEAEPAAELEPGPETPAVELEELEAVLEESEAVLEEVADQEPVPLPVPEGPEEFVVESAEGLLEVDGATRSEPPAPGVDEDLFPEVSDASDRDRYLSALESEGLFFAPLKDRAVEVPTPAAVSAPVPPAAEAEDDEEGVVFHLPPVGAEEVPSLPKPGFHPMAAGLVTDGDKADEAKAGESVAPGALETMHLPAGARPTAEPVETEAEPEADAAPSRPAPEAEAEPAAEPPVARATATLGQLYLQQGHRGEAEKIFRKVLEDEPTNPVALAGLRMIADAEGAGEPSPLRAAELLQGAEVKGLTARKVLMLNGYLRRLRREA